jgi:AbrB family looped-hinge helix DNA binding protein
MPWSNQASSSRLRFPRGSSKMPTYLRTLKVRGEREPLASAMSRRSITGRGNTMRVTTKGQVTIPLAIREKLGLLPNTEVEFHLQGNAARLVKAVSKDDHGRGTNVVRHLAGKADVRMTTDQILALTRKAK